MITMKESTEGVSFWVDGKWVLDASTVLRDGEITIDTSKFDIEFDGKNSRLVLRLKESAAQDYAKQKI